MINRFLISLFAFLCLATSGQAQITNVVPDSTKLIAVARELYFENNKPSSEQIIKAFDTVDAGYYPIDCAPWPMKNNGYVPFASFRVGYSDTTHELYIQYRVAEKCIRALYGEDVVAKPWTDTCLEFFCTPGPGEEYYNLELNCIGIGILQYGLPGLPRNRAGKDKLSLVRRESSLGNEPFGEKVSKGALFEYTMTVAIPLELFYGISVPLMKGKVIRANFYHCADSSAFPHYVCWNPVLTEKPRFHTPEYFGNIFFE